MPKKGEMMDVLLSKVYRVAGTIKFDSSVPWSKLAVFISELRTNRPKRWVDLHVRGAGKDGTHFIVFHYILPDGKEETQDEVMSRIIQYLGNQLGTCPKKAKNGEFVPRGVTEWLISTVKATA